MEEMLWGLDLAAEQGGHQIELVYQPSLLQHEGRNTNHQPLTNENIELPKPRVFLLFPRQTSPCDFQLGKPTGQHLMLVLEWRLEPSKQLNVLEL